jgi:Pyruvate/2-oxoacid:ferredoxin oxidoreductase gamma subunit
MTLLVLNNFNFGMTGGQCSATTPSQAEVASGFLNRLDRPLDLHSLAVAAGAPYMATISGYQKGLESVIEEAIRYDGFAVIDVHGICPGRFTRRNKLTPKAIADALDLKRHSNGPVAANTRREYGQAYRSLASRQEPAKPPRAVEPAFTPLEAGRREVILLGSAGQRVITAGELLGLAGMSAGLHVTQKNDYDITVLRGPSIAELILSPGEIDYPVIDRPSVILALAPEGVSRRKTLFGRIDGNALIIQASGVEIPQTEGTVKAVDFKAMGLKVTDWSLAALAVMAKMDTVLDTAMLDAAILHRFRGEALAGAKTVVGKVMEQDF